jgi:hypothetical protein
MLDQMPERMSSSVKAGAILVVVALTMLATIPEMAQAGEGDWCLENLEFVQSAPLCTTGAPVDVTLSMFWKPDGTKLYCTRNFENIDEYDVSTPWDISTLTCVNTMRAKVEEGLGLCLVSIFWKPDGTKLYQLGTTTFNFCYLQEYNVSTPWDMTTATYLHGGSGISMANDLWWKPDGTKLYTTALHPIENEIREYNISTPWDISTANFLHSKLPSAPVTEIFWKPDGTKLYGIYGPWMPPREQKVYEYDASVPWDVTTINLSRTLNIDENILWDLFWKPDGRTLYVLVDIVDYQGYHTQIWQYSIPSEPPFHPPYHFPLAAVLLLLYFVVSAVLAAGVYRDSRGRRMNRKGWAGLTFLTSVVGLAAYLKLRRPRQRAGKTGAGQKAQKSGKLSCSKCGAKIPRGVDFCPFCGTKLRMRRGG